MEVCTEEFARLSQTVPNVKCDGSPFVTFTSPFELSNWTLPVIEWLCIIGAALCLVHAIRWYRRTGDSSNLVVWITGVTALLLIEPTSYFPQWFGLEDSLGLTFVHNQFTVNFLYNRIPLYILAIYPLFLYLSYILVQRTGIFARYHSVVSACAVATVFHFLWEVIDGLGSQWLWWVWNTQVSTAQPALGIVPLLNVQVFTILMPFSVSLIPLLLRRLRHGGGWPIVRDVVISSLVMWPIIFLGALPSTIVDLMGGSLEVGRTFQCWTLVAVAVGVGSWAYIGAFRARRRDISIVPVAADGDYLALAWCSVYLVVTAVFWVVGLPDYFGAVDLVTAAGGQIGSLPYAIFAYLGSIVLLWASYAGTSRRTTLEQRSRETVTA